MKTNEQIKKLSLEEKAALLQGKTTWTTYERKHADIPEIFLADGPHGLRKQVGSADHLGINESIPATCFPTAATMANSWNLSLGEELGKALGEEAAANDVHVVLGPGLNIKRSPLCGRNFEYFSEDPYLSGKMAASYIKGIQANGVAACPKHFAINSQELRRMAMDSVLDERTMREIYLTAFEIAIKEGQAKTIMSSYNMINGTYANENKHILTDILRKEWGFDGFVVTDWGADNDHTEGVRAGSNLVMPNPGADCALGLINDVKNGKIEESVLDDRLFELLNVVNSTSEAVKKASKSFDKEKHHEIAKRCAAESIVLLENDGVLPLSEGQKVVIIGDFANSPRYQGAGSSQVNPIKTDDLLSCALASSLNVMGYAQGYDRTNPNPNKKMIKAAVDLAKEAETVLLCVGLEEILESEGMDRMHMELSQSQQQLIEKVCAVNSNVILILSGGAPFVMPKHNYRAVIHGYLGGGAGASAMLDTLLGKNNPSGKLNETWPLSLSDTPCSNYYPSKERTAEYREGLYVGYRYYDSANIPVKYPFGYGLSYTKFEYSNIVLNSEEVRFTLKNIGGIDGSEIAQIYISCDSENVYRPKKELKGFTKVFLKAGESQEISVKFDDKAFRYFDVTTNSWQIEDADYTVMVSRNVSEIELQATIHISGIKPSVSYPACYKEANIKNVSDEDYEKLLGRKIPDGSWSGKISENDAFCQLYYSKGIFARLLYKILTSLKNDAEKKGKTDINILFVYNMPFRALSKVSIGMVSKKMTDDVVFMMNGHFFRGFGHLIVDFFKNKKNSSKFKKHLEQLDETI